MERFTQRVSIAKANKLDPKCLMKQLSKSQIITFNVDILLWKPIDKAIINEILGRSLRKIITLINAICL